jgi:general secretion pathway protein N
MQTQARAKSPANSNWSDAVGKAFKIVLGLTLLGLFIFGVVLLTLPATVAYRLGAERLPPGVALESISGSIWQGRAEQVRFNAIDVGALDWRINKSLPLIADLTLSGTEVAARGRVSRADAGAYTVREVTVDAPARLLDKALGLPGFVFTGQVTGALNEVTIRPPGVIQASGELVWSGAGLSVPYAVALGTYAVNFTPTPTGAVGVISDRGGDLAVSGTVEWLGTRYRANVRLAARSGPPELARALQYVGAPNADGSRQLLIEGDLL